MTKNKPGEFIASLQTQVPAVRSIGQIQALVERFGALEFATVYDSSGSGRPVGLRFKVRDPHITKEDAERRAKRGVPPAHLPVDLRAPFEMIYKALLDRRTGWLADGARQRIRAQAERVAWRNLHDYVRAGLIAVQTGILTLGEAFLANVSVELPDGTSARFGSLVAERGMISSGTNGRLRLQPGTETIVGELP